MAWHFAGSFACLIAGIICFVLVAMGVVTGPLSFGLLALSAINYIMAVFILVEGRKKR